MEKGTFFVTLKQLCEEFNLEVIYEGCELSKRKVISTELNRPGLPITGFFEYFQPERLQILGRVEYTYLKNMTSEQRLDVFTKIAAQDVPAIIITRGQEVIPEIVEGAKTNNIPVFRTEEQSSKFMAAVISYLSVALAPRITRHGVLVEVYGEGLLILGESGVGKSETAIELVKRGHRLVADDAVEIKRVSDKTLVGTSPEIIRHFIELRGIGIVDVRRIFGMGSIKETEKIDLVVNLEVWKQDKQYDRLGLVTEYTDILGLQVPCLNIPVRPGRNLAVVLEVAAMNNRQKKLGYNPAEELNNRLLKKMEEDAGLEE
ncbi:MAG: HPr kinase/phosphorylase [Ruminococcaceae bacterium]|nr:HPr kinase/phosphorylase [Oscillospiraceae bacterium]